MAEPKKRRSSRRQGMHRSHLVRQLAKRVNAHSPVKVSVGGKKKAAVAAESSTATKSDEKKATKPTASKAKKSDAK